MGTQELVEEHDGDFEALRREHMIDDAGKHAQRLRSACKKYTNNAE